MKKVSSLNFYGFVELYRILKDKFSDFSIQDLYWKDGYFTISKVPYDDCEEGEVTLEVLDPCPSDMETDEIEKLIDVESRVIKIRFYLFGADVCITAEVEQSAFDDDNFFVYELKKIIGSIPNVRKKKNENFQSEAEAWLKQLLQSSAIKDFITEIKDS